MSFRFARSAALVAAIGLAACSGGEGAPADVRVTDAWTRATVAGQSSAAVYLTIANSGRGSDRLLDVSTPIAKDASLHSSSSEGGVMRMRALRDGVPVPAGARVKLEPSGNHAMLTGLSAPLAKGSNFPLTLRFERSGKHEVQVQVLDPATSGHAMEGMCRRFVTCCGHWSPRRSSGSACSFSITIAGRLLLRNPRRQR
jgi:copper(I)-binding protein